MTQEEINTILKQQQEETTASLWGKEVTFKPYLLEQVFGDGMQLIYFGTLDDRPYWWLVRIDSHTDIEDPLQFDSEKIYCAIEDECGGWVPDDTVKVDADGYDEYDICHRGEYPMIISDSSCHYGVIANFNED